MLFCVPEQLFSSSLDARNSARITIDIAGITKLASLHGRSRDIIRQMSQYGWNGGTMPPRTLF
jgi:hypothetical protein